MDSLFVNVSSYFFGCYLQKSLNFVQKVITNKAQCLCQSCVQKTRFLFLRFNFNISSLLETSCLFILPVIPTLSIRCADSLTEISRKRSLYFQYQRDFTRHLLFLFFARGQATHLETDFSVHCFSLLLSFFWTVRHTLSQFSLFFPITTFSIALFTDTQKYSFIVFRAHLTEQLQLSGGFCQMYVLQRCLNIA